jgi:eukaryotic-like serine/threonine-protein kinase
LKAWGLSVWITVGYSDGDSEGCMLTPPKSPDRLAFGPFEVNALSGELVKHGSRVRLPKQPFQILLSLLEQPGELVTREQLLAKIWGDGTFVDFEHSLNAAMNRLRQSLGDSAEKPRYIETVPGRGYRFIGALERQASTTVPIAAEPVIRKEPRQRRAGLWWSLAVALVGLLSLAVWWRFRDHGDTLSSAKFIRLTTNAGLSDSPAISRDGKLVAYSSDIAAEGQMDLYIKQVTGGQSIRLTFDGAGNTTPDFSPDGSRIVFRSNRDGGGIYEIPAFGGQARLLAPNGLDPKFSPDGSQVTYWVGAPGVALAAPRSGAVWVIRSAGGQPRRLGANFTNARYPIWSPDGKHLLFEGFASPKAYESVDWWLVNTNGGEAVRTGLYDALVRAGLQGSDGATSWMTTVPNVPEPSCWLASSNSLIFFADSGGDVQNLWETEISPVSGKVSGAFRRVTAGSGNDMAPSCAPGGALVFANHQLRTEVWSLPLGGDHGKPMRGLEEITEGPAKRDHASLSSNGRYVAFASSQSGPMNIWLRELDTGKESPVASSSLAQRFPVVSANGSVAFSVPENGKRSVYVSALGGAPEKLCEGCFRATDWSRDEKALLIFTGDPYQVSVLTVASHQQRTILKHPEHDLLYARFSPDNRWVSFTERRGPDRSRIMIAPVEDGPKPVPDSAWIEIAEEGAEDWANWSADGKTLYFTSARDGHYCFWGQRIDAVSHRPEGEAFAVAHLHGRAPYAQKGWSAAAGRIAMVLSEETGSIWMMSRSGVQ